MPTSDSTDPTAETLPLTSAQRGVYDAVRLDPTSSHYVVGEVLELHGTVDVATLTQAITATHREAETLRLRIAATGDEPRQRVAPEVAPVEVRDLRATRHPKVLAEALVDAAKTELAEQIQRAGLVEVPLCLYRVLVLSPEETWVIQLYHHLIVDGYSAALLSRRIAAHYRALLSGHEPKPYRGAPLSQLVADDRAYLASRELREDREYFRGLAGSLPDLKEREKLNAATGSAPGSGRTLTTTVRLPRTAREELDAAARELGTTWVTAVTALWAAFVWQDTGRRPEPLVLAIPMMARRTRAWRATPAMGVNVLPLAVVVTQSATLAELIRETDRKFRELAEHQCYRGEWLPQDLDIPGAGALLHGAGVNAKVFDVHLDFGEAQGALRNVAGGPPEDYGLVVTPTAEGGADLGLETDPARVSGEKARQLLEEFSALVHLAPTRLSAPLGEVCGPDAVEETALIDARRALTPQEKPQPLRTLIEKLAGQKTCLITDDETLSADELRRRVLELSRRLPRGNVIGIDLDRGTELVVTVLAALHAGVAFTCLDPQAPARRQRDILARVGAHWVAGRDPLPVPRPEAQNAQTGEPTSEDLAYVLFTSGSTGEPKGVEVTRGNLEALLAGHLAGLYRRQRGLVAHTAAFTFDAALDQLLWLLAGHCVRLYSEDILDDPAEMVARLDAEGITVMDSTPSLMGALIGAGLLELPALRLVVVGGEALPQALWDQLAHTRVAAINVYGPTECCIDALTADVVPGAAVIGRPVAGMRAYALSEGKTLAGPGEKARLYLAGPQVARGYLDDEERTREAFITTTVDPRRGPERLYDTGDLVRWLPQRGYEFLGRVDDQLEVNGRRIEPGEIESALVAAPGVMAAAVVVRGRAGLVGCVVPEAGAELSEESVRAEAARRLPAGLVPGRIRLVDTLPVTTSGKVDRARLRADMDAEHAGEDSHGEADATVGALLESCQETIGIPMQAGEGFIAQGGDSIGALLVATRLRDSGWHVTPKELLSGASLGEVAAAMTRDDEAVHSAGVACQPVGAAPLSPVAARQWDSCPDAQSWAAYRQYGELGVSATRTAAEKLAAQLVEAHASLRAVFDPDGPDGPALIIPRTSLVDPAECVKERRECTLDEVAQEPGLIDPEAGRMLAVVLLEDRVGLVVHHLAVDALSWTTLRADAHAVLAGTEALTPSDGLRSHLQSTAGDPHDAELSALPLEELAHWASVRRACSETDLHRGPHAATRAEATTVRRAVGLRAGAALAQDPETAMLAAIARAHAQALHSGGRSSGDAGMQVVIGVEGHGRDGALITEREVGWFTVEYPLVIEVPEGVDPLADAVDLRRCVTEARAAVPGEGAGFAQLAASPAGALQGLDLVSPAVVVNVIPAAAEAFGVADSPRRRCTEEMTCNVFVHAQASETTAEIEYTVAGGHEDVDSFHARVVAELEAQVAADESGICDQPTRAIEAAYGAMEEVLPASPQQAGMLFEVMAHDADPYAVAMRVDLVANDPDSVSLGRLKRRWVEVLERHPGVMMGFDATAAGQPVQFLPSREVRRAQAYASFRGVDARCLAALSGDAETVVNRFVSEARDRDVDISRPPLVRASVVRTSETEATLVISGHHLLTDNWSTGILLKELLDDATPRADLHEIEKVRAYLRRVERHRVSDTSAWRAYVAGAEPTQVADSQGTEDAEITLPVLSSHPREEERILERAEERARQIGATAAELVDVAWAIVLGELSGHSDVVFGVTVSGRPLELTGIGDVMGLFATTLPARVDVNGREDFEAMLREFHDQRLELNERTAASVADMGASQLFDTIVVTENVPDPDGEGALKIARTDSLGQTHYPMTVVSRPGRGGGVVLAYRPALVSNERAEWAAHRLGEILRAVARGDDKAPRAHLRPPQPRQQAAGSASGISIGTSVDDAAATIAREMGDLLDRRVGWQESFSEAGGHSLLAVELLGRLRRSGLKLTVGDILAGESPRGIAARIGAQSPGEDWISVQTFGDEVPTIWCMPPASGLHAPWQDLATSTGCRVRALTWNDRLQAESLTDAARHVAQRICSVQPSGPYRLAGWSFGGALAHAVAVELGGPAAVDFLGILDAYPAVRVWSHARVRRAENAGEGLAEVFGLDVEKLAAIDPEVRQAMEDNVARSASLLEKAAPLGWDGQVCVVVATRTRLGRPAGKRPWDPVAAWQDTGADVHACEVAEDHFGVVSDRGWEKAGGFFLHRLRDLGVM
ncbi:hypothetical protein C3B44_01885 [Corynebacterium yudongzhengii]|uniref:Carrier domain-containing protein n=1 Tax=Corynebacterium yudongzhengii TaxID=2080740 RepID=A0A2U1TA41_9CORY|nr:condensation domain-containing protein [Corynebacterium yudongzhengii]AWB81246.1 hypothetical protein C3B44_01885 [Corynebacterium yudongzhengii]PWC02785.1 hypothetical protein DF222_00615 [Corynebacterium yudongzhengii]